MLGFFSRKTTILDSGLLQGFTDHHSHLLPGVDDGMRSKEETLEALDYMERVGVKEVWFTPHVMEDVPNTPLLLSQCFSSFKNDYKGGIKLNLAAENMIDNLLVERWTKREMLELSPKHYLVETSYFRASHELKGVIGEMVNADCVPVLAHPERYRYMTDDDYHYYKSLGVKFQLNLGSIVGLYSEYTKQRAEQLLKKGLYNLIGSDIHNLHFYEKSITTPLAVSVVELLKNIPNKL
ncbi:MAG: capsular biosynthesis protein [bacterium]|nr:capsular biosynthesis protein [bacterium]